MYKIYTLDGKFVGIGDRIFTVLDDDGVEREVISGEHPFDCWYTSEVKLVKIEE